MAFKRAHRLRRRWSSTRRRASGSPLYPDDGADVATVLKHADTAMYQAKSGAAESDRRLHAGHEQPAARTGSSSRHACGARSHEDRLHLVFQPKFRLHDNQLAGVEALLRWCDAEYGDIPPTRFIEIAEDSGLILDMGSWVVRAACRQLREWLDRGLHRSRWPSTCSGKELLHGDPARVIETEAAAAGVPDLADRGRDHRVAAGQGLRRRAAARCKRLRQLGCRIALDDFGTGYSSLAYITRFPPDRIKIDKAFVRDVDRSASDAAIANAILSLGASLNLIVTAEGIERPGQLEWLRARGCHEAQGFLLSRPLSPAELEHRFLRPAGAAPQGQDEDAVTTRARG